MAGSGRGHDGAVTSQGLLAAGGAAGLVVGVLLVRYLERRTYRYEDEADLPTGSARWVAVATPLALALVLAGQVPRVGALGVLLGGFTPVLVALSAIDLDTRRLPDRWVGPGVAVAVAGLGVVAALGGSWTPVLAGVLGGAALGGFYLANVVVGELVGAGGGMGLGDAKFAVLLGLLLGPLSWAHVVVATVLAFATAGMQALYLVLVRRATRRSSLAFGPHLALGAGLVLAAPGVAVLLGGGW